MKSDPAHSGFQQPWRIGLTGGIGSGKSMVSSILAQEYGALILDADATARALTQPGGAAVDDIRQAFGENFITADGALDREKMRALVFADADARQRLERILHPLVRSAMLAYSAASFDGKQCMHVFDVPLLTESIDDWRALLDCIWALECTRATQIRRVKERSGLDTAVIEAIIAAQANPEQRRKVADHVIVNEADSLAELRQKVRDAVAQSFARLRCEPK